MERPSIPEQRRTPRSLPPGVFCRAHQLRLRCPAARPRTAPHRSASRPPRPGPRARRTISATMASPSPTPPRPGPRESSSRTKRSKMSSRRSSGTPGPSSSTVRTAWSHPRLGTPRPGPSRCAWARAFWTRLRTTARAARRPRTAAPARRRWCRPRSGRRAPNAGDGLVDDVVEVHGGHPEPGDVGVGAGQERGAGPPGPPSGPSRASMSRSRAPGPPPVPGRLQLHAQARDRAAQLVRGVRDEPALSSRRCARADRASG